MARFWILAWFCDLSACFALFAAGQRFAAVCFGVAAVGAVANAVLHATED